MITLKKVAVAAKRATIVGAAFIFGSSAYAAGNLNLNVGVTGSVVTSCEADQTDYQVDFGTISGLTVGKANTHFYITCSLGVNYTIKPDTDFVNAGIASTVITPYQDAAYTTPMTTANYLNLTGSGVQQEIPIYFKWSSDHQYNSYGIDRGEGKILQEAGSITGNAEVFRFTFEYN